MVWKQEEKHICESYQKIHFFKNEFTFDSIDLGVQKVSIIFYNS